MPLFYARCKQNGRESVKLTVFTAEQRATTGKYASEYGNPAAVKKFKANIEGGQLGESTVCLFKKRYIEELKQNPSGARPKQLY